MRFTAFLTRPDWDLKHACAATNETHLDPMLGIPPLVAGQRLSDLPHPFLVKRSLRSGSSPGGYPAMTFTPFEGQGFVRTDDSCDLSFGTLAKRHRPRETHKQCSPGKFDAIIIGQNPPSDLRACEVQCAGGSLTNPEADRQNLPMSAATRGVFYIAGARGQRRNIPAHVSVRQGHCQTRKKSRRKSSDAKVKLFRHASTMILHSAPRTKEEQPGHLFRAAHEESITSPIQQGCLLKGKYYGE